MSCADYEIEELEGIASEQGSEVWRPKPFIMPSRPGRHEDLVARRVAEVLNFELAQGAMPT
jgi:hypothetical protein